MKKTRSRCSTIAATKTFGRPVVRLADQQAGLDGREMSSTERYASRHVLPLQRRVRAVVDDLAVLSSKKNVRYVPVATSTMNA